MDDNNTPQVDDQFLAAMGLTGLEGEEKQKALEDILYTLNINVGKRVAEDLSEEQTDEFDHLTDGEDVDEQALADWLKTNVPNYEQLINEEAEKMRQQATDIAQRVMNAPSG